MNAVVAIERTGLAKYDAMQRAIVAASSVDEVKDIRDKAAALEKYAKLARNFDAEKRCAGIRIEAMTKGGELARAELKAKGASTKGAKKDGPRGKVTSSNHAEAVTQVISKDERAVWQQLAQSPEKVKDYLNSADGVPTVAGALAAVNPVKRTKTAPPKHPFSEDALWIWGRIGDIDRRGINPQQIFEGCDEPKRRDLIKHLDNIIPLLKTLRQLL